MPRKPGSRQKALSKKDAGKPCLQRRAAKTGTVRVLQTRVLQTRVLQTRVLRTRSSIVFRLLLIEVFLCSGLAWPLEKESGLTAAEINSEQALPDILDLETAQRRALADNPSLQVAAEQVAMARELVKQARSLYFPQIDASYSASYTWLPDTALSVAPESEDTGRNIRRTRRSEELIPDIQAPTWLPFAGLITDTLDAARRVQDDLERILGAAEDPALYAFKQSPENYSLGVTAGFILFDGFSRKFSNAMAKFGHKETEAAHSEAKRLLLAAVAQSFYGTQLARESTEVAKADEGFNKRLLEEAKARRRMGKGSTSDVLNFEIRQRAARTVLLMAEGEYQAARIALATLMGLPDAVLPERVRVSELRAETVDDMRRPVADDMVQYALECRPGVAQSEYSVKRAKAAVKQRYSDFYPRIAAFGSQDARRFEDTKFDEDDFATTVGVNVSYDIFSGGRRRSKVLEAKHARRQAEHRLNDEELKVVAEVRNALVRLKIAQEQIVLQRTMTDYVGKNRDLVEKAYDAGKAPLALLNQAQRDLVQAQVHLAVAQVSLRQAWYALRTATGETLGAFEETE